MTTVRTVTSMNHPHIRNTDSHTVTGDHVDIDGECWYRISNCHLMPEFFINPVSSSDHWMFISSEGALSAGRRNADSALFPYYSSDKLVDTAACTGPRTIIRVQATDGRYLNWEPFAGRLGPEQRVADR